MLDNTGIFQLKSTQTAMKDIYICVYTTCDAEIKRAIQGTIHPHPYGKHLDLTHMEV